MKRSKQLTIVSLFATVLIGGPAASQDLFVYPTKGQSEEQTEKDKFDCYSWGKQNSGFDPMQVPQATTAPPQTEPQQGGVGRGVTRGALGGLAIGAIAGDAGKGAAIGAVGGGMVGGMRRREQEERQQRERQQWEREQGAQYSQARNAYNRAYAACLEARGYSVK